MTDKELLELAAKAADMDGYLAVYGWAYDDPASIALDNNEPQEKWNPLADDGDALRLAVKLNLFDGDMFEHQRAMLAMAKFLKFKDHIDEDDYAATRRAIVRAAAEIGKTLK